MELCPHFDRYSLCPRDESGHVAKYLETEELLNSLLIHMFQYILNSYQVAMSYVDVDKWQQASREEFDGLTEMGVWELVP